MTDTEKRELQKEILLQEHEAEQEIGLYSAELRGHQEAFRALADHVSTLLSHVGSGWNDPAHRTELIRNEIVAITPRLEKYGLTAVADACNEVKAAWDRLQTARERKREAGMIRPIQT